MADPLTMLRLYNIEKKEIKFQNNRIFFGDLSWPKTVETNYLIYGYVNDTCIELGEMTDFYV